MASVLQMILEFRDRSVLGRNHNFNQNTNHNSPYLYLSVLTTVIPICTLVQDPVFHRPFVFGLTFFPGKQTVLKHCLT